MSNQESAEFLFSDEARAADTRHLHQSKAYAEEELVIFKSKWIKRVISIGNRHLVSPGPFILSPVEYEPLIDELLEREGNKNRLETAADILHDGETHRKDIASESLCPEAASSRDAGMEQSETSGQRERRRNHDEGEKVRLVRQRETERTQTLAEVLAVSKLRQPDHLHEGNVNCQSERSREGTRKVSQQTGCGLCKQVDTVTDEDLILIQSSSKSAVVETTIPGCADKVSSGDLVRSEGTETGRHGDREAGGAEDEGISKDTETRRFASRHSGRCRNSKTRMSADKQIGRPRDQESCDFEVSATQRSRAEDVERVGDTEKGGNRQPSRNKKTSARTLAMVLAEKGYRQPPWDLATIGQASSSKQTVQTGDATIRESQSQLCITDQAMNRDFHSIPGVVHIESLTLSTEVRLREFKPSLQGCYVTLK